MVPHSLCQPRRLVCHQVVCVCGMASTHTLCQLCCKSHFLILSFVCGTCVIKPLRRVFSLAAKTVASGDHTASVQLTKPDSNPANDWDTASVTPFITCQYPYGLGQPRPDCGYRADYVGPDNHILLSASEFSFCCVSQQLSALVEYNSTAGVIAHALLSSFWPGNPSRIPLLALSQDLVCVGVCWCRHRLQGLPVQQLSKSRPHPARPST